MGGGEGGRSVLDFHERDSSMDYSIIILHYHEMQVLWALLTVLTESIRLQPTSCATSDHAVARRLQSLSSCTILWVAIRYSLLRYSSTSGFALRFALQWYFCALCKHRPPSFLLSGESVLLWLTADSAPVFIHLWFLRVQSYIELLHGI